MRRGPVHRTVSLAIGQVLNGSAPLERSGPRATIRPMEQQVDVTAGATLVRRHDLALGYLTASRFPADLALPPHNHPLATVAVVVAGGFDGRYRAGARDCNVRSVIVEPAGETHANRFGKAETTILTLSLDAARLDRVAQPAAERFGVNRDAYAALIARRAVDELDRPDDVTPLAIEAAALEIVARIARRTPGEHRPSWLGSARDYLHDRYAESIALAEVASAVGVEPERLARAFQRAMGEPMAGYLRRLRIDAAATLLRTTDLPISQIAGDVGFADQSHLTRWFGVYLGTTPSRYRNAR